MRRNLEESKKYFYTDNYASLTGIEIDSVGEGYAKCSLKLDTKHKNVRGAVQGGVIFTLADFCYGVASDGVAVSITSEVNYLTSTKGSILYAEAKEIKNGRSTVFYKITVTDDLDKTIAFLTMTGFKI